MAHGSSPKWMADRRDNYSLRWRKESLTINLIEKLYYLGQSLSTQTCHQKNWIPALDKVEAAEPANGV